MKKQFDSPCFSSFFTLGEQKFFFRILWFIDKLFQAQMPKNILF
jgi:hypothetical protein